MEAVHWLFTLDVFSCFNYFLYLYFPQMIQREIEVKNKVTAVALTDSVHNVWHQEADKIVREWMREVRLNSDNQVYNLANYHSHY